MKRDKKELSPFVETMLNKLEKKEVARPQSLLGGMKVDKDPELKPYISEDDVKKIEDEVKKIKERVK